MPPKVRKSGNQGLPDNLYTVDAAGTRYRYKHPVTGRFHGMGSDRTKAIQAARKLNLLLTSPVDLVGAGGGVPVGALVLALRSPWHIAVGCAPVGGCLRPVDHGAATGRRKPVPLPGIAAGVGRGF